MVDGDTNQQTQQETQQEKATERVRQKVEDALHLAQFVVSTGVTDHDGKPLAFGDIATIQGAAAALGLLDVTPNPPAPAAAGAAAPVAPAGTAPAIDTGGWLAFEQASR